MTRGKARTTSEDSEEFTGFAFGKRTTHTVCARIYDKTKQIEQKGIDWWPKVWGNRYVQGQQVLPIEFEIGRQGLVEFGVRTPHEGIEAAPRIWASVTTDWLSYRSPTEDGTKSRWPVTPEWTDVQCQASESTPSDSSETGRADVRANYETCSPSSWATSPALAPSSAHPTCRRRSELFDRSSPPTRSGEEWTSPLGSLNVSKRGPTNDRTELGSAAHIFGAILLRYLEAKGQTDDTDRGVLPSVDGRANERGLLDRRPSGEAPDVRNAP